MMGIVQGLVQTVLSEGKIKGKVEFHLGQEMDGYALQ